MVEFISIIVLTFALSMVVLGLITVWLERARGRIQGFALVGIGLATGAGFAFLGSRFSLGMFDRLIVAVDLPALMGTAFMYTTGVLGGGALGVGMFLWATGRFRHRVERTTVALVLIGAFVAMAATLLAIALSTPR